MRSLIIFFLMLASCLASAQEIRGVVVDKQSRQPVAIALINSSTATAFTDMHCRFSIAIKNPNDTIAVRAVGYSIYQFTRLPTNQSITIELNRQAITLNEVKVFAKRDRIKDSLANRAMFAKAFNSSAPKFKDIVRVTKSAGPLPVAGITIIPSELIRALAYKNSRASKFKKTLLRDESDKYIYDRFNTELVTNLTKLQADSLSMFMEKYRPNITALKKMSSYDLMIYIKKSLVSFKSTR